MKKSHLKQLIKQQVIYVYIHRGILADTKIHIDWWLLNCGTLYEHEQHEQYALYNHLHMHQIQVQQVIIQSMMMNSRKLWWLSSWQHLSLSHSLSIYLACSVSQPLLSFVYTIRMDLGNFLHFKDFTFMDHRNRIFLISDECESNRTDLCMCWVFCVNKME